MSDEYLMESGVQGGKIIAEKLVWGYFLIGIPLFAIGIFSWFYMVFVSGVPSDWPIVLYILNPQTLATIIGLILIIGGYFVYRDKHVKN